MTKSVRIALLDWTEGPAQWLQEAHKQSMKGQPLLLIPQQLADPQLGGQARSSQGMRLLTLSADRPDGGGPVVWGE